MNELSDKNKPRNLEDIFREGMGEAEIKPSVRLWERIDHKLDTKEAVFYKERMVWFQRLAAACIVLVLFTGGYLFYDYRTIEKPQVAVSENLPAEQSSETNNANNIKTNTADTEIKQPQTATNDLSKTENTIIAKAQRAPIYTRNRSTLQTVAITKLTPETEKLINVSDTNIDDVIINPGLALVNESQIKEDKAKASYSEQAAAKSWTSLENKSNTLDTTATIALNKPTAVATETVASVAANETVKKQASRWSLSGKYASHYFNQNIALAENSRAVAANSQVSFGAPLASAGSSNLSEAMQEYDKNTMSSYSYNTSIGAAYQLNNQWAIEPGVDYTQNVATTSSSYVFSNSEASRNFNSLMPGVNNDNNNVVSVPTTALLASLAGPVDAVNTGVVKTETFNTQYRYRLIGIPVKVNYKTSGKKSFYYVSGGLLTNFLMQAHILSASPIVPDIKYTAKTESPFNDLQMAGTLSVGRGFRITKEFSLRAGLEASKYFTSLAAHPEYSEGKHGKPYTIGIALSSNYSLGK